MTTTKKDVAGDSSSASRATESSASAQELAEEIKASDAANAGDDKVHEHDNRVDRAVVLNAWMKSAALFSVRAMAIFILIGVLAYLVGKFWAGVLPIVLALIVCTVLEPITSFLRNRGVPGALSALVSMLIAVGVLVFFVSMILPDIITNSRVLSTQATRGMQSFALWLQNNDSLPFTVNAEQLNEVYQDAVTWVQNRAGAIAGGIFSGISTATSMVVTLVVVMVLTFFFLNDGPKFLPWVRSATGGRAGLHATELLTRIWNTLCGYIRAQAVVSFIDAVCIGTGLWIVGVPMAFTLAVITFMAGFIPLVGAIVAGALAVIIALVSLGLTEALIVLAIVIAVQQLEGNVLSPLLQSRAMNLHPVIVLVSVTVGGGLFGLVGAFLAVPVAATIAVIFRYMQDMLRLHAGEISASDVEFATSVGKQLAEAEERESAKQRDELVDDLIWQAPTIDRESTPSPSPSATLIKQWNSLTARRRGEKAGDGQGGENEGGREDGHGETAAASTVNEASAAGPDSGDPASSRNADRLKQQLGARERRRSKSRKFELPFGSKKTGGEDVS